MTDGNKILSNDEVVRMEMRVMSAGCTDRDFRALMDSHETLRQELANLDARTLYEVARYAVECELVELRDRRISIMGRNNGLVIKEEDGTDSDIIRLSVEAALRIGMRAYIQDKFGIEPALDLGGS